MHGGFQPCVDERIKCVRGHSGVRGGDNIEEPLLARGGERFLIAVEYGLEWLHVRPLGMRRRHRLDRIHCEGELEIDRLFGP